MRWKDNRLALHKHITSTMGSHERRRDVCCVSGDILVYSWTRRLFDSAAGTLARTLASVTARPVVKGDGLPTLLCRTCQRKLEKTKELELKLKPQDYHRRKNSILA